jgi:hypothetical protein
LNQIYIATRSKSDSHAHQKAPRRATARRGERYVDEGANFHRHGGLAEPVRFLGMHVRAVGAAVDLRDPRLDERDQVVLKAAGPQMLFHTEKGSDAIRGGRREVQSLRRRFDPT